MSEAAQTGPEPVTPGEAEAIRVAVKRCTEAAGPLVARYRKIAQVNERFCLGDQWSFQEWKGGAPQAVADAWFDAEGVPRIHINHTQNLLLTWTSLLTGDRPSAIARGSNRDDQNGEFFAAIANKLIEHFVAALDTAEVLHEVAYNAGQHGLGALKVFIDPETGGVAWEPLTIFDYFRDPRAAKVKDAHWCIFETWISVEEAERLYDGAGIQKKPGEQPYRNGAGEELKGVHNVELWMKPTREFPEGLYACLIDDEVVERTVFPNRFRIAGREQFWLPLLEMKPRRIRGSAYGFTNLTDVIPLQRSLNEVNARILKRWRLDNPHLVMPQSMAATEVEDGSTMVFDPSTTNVIGVPNNLLPTIGSLIQWTAPPPISPQLYQERDFYKVAMNDVMGVNEVTGGTKTRASLSGRAIENIRELDRQKNADATKALSSLTVNAWVLTLALMQRFASPEQLAALTNEIGVNVEAFRGVDLQGADVRLEPASETDKLDESEDAKADERAQAGLPDDATRSRQRVGAGMSRDAAEQMVTDVLAGKSVDIQPDDYDLHVVADVVDRHMAKAMKEGRKDDWAALQTFMRFLRELAKSATVAAPTGEAEPDPNAPPEGAPA